MFPRKENSRSPEHQDFDVRLSRRSELVYGIHGAITSILNSEAGRYAVHDMAQAGDTEAQVYYPQAAVPDYIPQQMTDEVLGTVPDTVPQGRVDEVFSVPDYIPDSMIDEMGSTAIGGAR